MTPAHFSQFSIVPPPLYTLLATTNPFSVLSEPHVIKYD